MRSAVIAMVLVTGGVASAAGPDITPRDYQLYMDWKDGREDPRLESYSEAVKLRKIAAQSGVSAKELQRIIDKVEPLAATLKADSEKAIAQALEDTPIAKQVMTVEVNTSTGHVVAWVKWRCGDPRDVDKEAVWVAWGVSEGGTVVKTLGLWCVNEIDTKLFSAKIGREGFERISKATIERFASTRYIRLFEEVKRGPHR